MRITKLHSLQGLLLLALGQAAFAQPLSIEEIVTLKRVTSVRLAPDGERIAYLVNVPRTPYEDDDGSAYQELHVTDLQGETRPYISGEVNVSNVAWSIDGEMLYYLAERDDDELTSLYSIPVDGGESRKIYEHLSDIESFELSPDGRHVAFLAEEAPPEQREALATKGFRALVYEESARPTRVWLLDLQAEDPAAVPADLPGSASRLRWSPDGARYVVALAPTPLIDDFYVSRKLHVVDAGQGRIVTNLDNVGKLGQFEWSVDGSEIAYIGAEDVNDPLEGRVYVAAANGEGIRNLTPAYPGHVQDIVWRDADQVLFVGGRGLWTEIDTLDVDGRSVPGSAPQAGPIVRAIDARPGIATVALLADTPTHPTEVYVWNERDGYRRLTDTNPWLADRDLASQEPVRYEARDGLEIEGVLVRPAQTRPNARVPLVIVVHGGPEAHYSHGWLSSYAVPAQSMAAQGYALFYPNYRASTGRGVEFSKLDHGDPAGAEFNDLVDAKTHLVEIGLADADRVGVTGGSYGGYATMWSATALTEHFAAGVAFVGISNQVSMYGTSDIPEELYLVHLRSRPWDDWLFALERSPVFHAGDARTPLLILAGDSDPRVHPSQSLELYRNIKERTDTPVRLVLYPDEGHGNRNTPAQLDYALRMTRWMDHYLKGPGGEPPPYELDHASRLESAQADAE